ncbi:MAG: SDR family oxidoreductase [Gammaproteobacteria bacterium]|nr:SDR family oxidoreductase [Gammaproteobacteria bacterium]
MRTVLVTGATSGIGEACVKKFATEGYRIIGLGRNEKQLEKVRTDALSYGAPECRTFSINLRYVAEVAELFRSLNDIEVIDAIINSAGIAYQRIIDEITIEEWEEVMCINLTAPVAIIKAALPWLRKSNNPSVINISSIAGRSRSISLGCHYTTSKAAVIGMTRHLAGELGPQGIRVNCTAPSQTHTPMLDAALSKESQDLLATKVPLKRLGTAEEQADVIFFLCTPAASYINGAIVDVNGGLL